MSSPWDPALYERFKAQREQPGRELLAGLKARPGCRAIDLGCGTGELTAALHQQLQAAETIGLDSSETMLARSEGRAEGGLRFELVDLCGLAELGRFDVIFSNAALHWVDGHESLLASLIESLEPGGLLAFQVPSNDAHPAHRLARELAEEEPFAAGLEKAPRESPVLRPEQYSALLYSLGCSEPRVELRVYLHELPGAESVFDWVSGTLLTWYQRELPDELWELYRERYRSRLLQRLPDRRPHPYTFQRVLAWASF